MDEVNWTAPPSEGIAAHWFKADPMSWSLMDAQRSDIPRTILGEGALIVIVGVGAGLIASMMLTRFLQTMLLDIEPTDPLTFGPLTILLAGVALLASFSPARKASRIDPLVALRHE
jgi:putative ABC transport system permease protein